MELRHNEPVLLVLAQRLTNTLDVPLFCHLSVKYVHEVSSVR